jgi:hypothetical protein
LKDHPMSEIFSPVKSTPTTSPRDTLVEVSHASGGGILLYRPDNNSFIALYHDEWLVCRADAHQNKTAIEELQEANRAVTEKSLVLQHLLQQPNSAKADIAQAEKDLDIALNVLAEKSEAAKKKVEAITNQKTDPNKLVELLPLTMKRMEGRSHTPIYVKAEKLKSALADRRVYLVEGATERKKVQRDNLFNGILPNPDEVRRRIGKQAQDSAKFEKKWKLAPEDADQFSGILTDWAKVMGTSATAFLARSQQEIASGIFNAELCDPKNPYRMIDTKPEAQFLRWSAGAGAAATFMPFQGSLYDARDKNWTQRFKRVAKSAQFSVKANAEASFAIGEAKVETVIYLPHAAGFHVSTRDLSQPLDLGYFRFRGDITLYALAGASVALEADVALMITGDKQGIRGTPKKQQGAKAKVGAKGEAQVFAGLKEGVDLRGALQWLSPEGYVNPKAPRKADANKAIAAYTDLASVTADVSLIEGLAATLGFECRYSGGNFVIAAKAGACLGLGGSASVGAKVKGEQIAQFCMFLAHQLKQADYKKILALMNETTFAVFNKILYLHIAVGRSIESFIGITARRIDDIYDSSVKSVISNGEEAIKQIEQQLMNGWGWYSYMPPESRGATISSIATAFNNLSNSGNNDLRKLAAFSINELMATIQSIGHLNNTLDRITASIGKESGRNQGVQLIKSVVAGTIFENCVEQCTLQVTQATPLMGRPFLRNDEPEFRFAQFPSHHPGYVVA